MGSTLGLYLHLPFCQRKCAYCDFPSYAGQLALREPYTQALVQEIRQRGQQTGPFPVDSIYLGGGTPSLMEPGQIRQIFRQIRDSFFVLPDAEISCEANPGSLNADFVQALVDCGVNRLSLGAQSAQARELRLLGRIHTWEQVAESVALARQAGIDNINLDLMSALPGQSWAHLKDSLQKALSLAPSHLSCYSLIIEPGTPFFEQFTQGQLALPGEEEERQLYWHSVQLLEQAGLPQYEISNFALPGQACRHNLNCWNYQDYLGFGASAASLFAGQRRKNPDSLKDYLAGQQPETTQLSEADQRFEQTMLGLRLKEGLSLAAFEARQGLSLALAYPEALDRQLHSGLLELAGGRLRLSRQGFDLMDRVLLDFLP